MEQQKEQLNCQRAKLHIIKKRENNINYKTLSEQKDANMLRHAFETWKTTKRIP